MHQPILLAIMGPTASGKTALAEELAGNLDSVLVSADAFQVYRGLDVGTAKPSNPEKYELLDLKNPDQPFGLGEWTGLAQRSLEEAFLQGRNTIVVGGTGLYIRALFEEYAAMADDPDPEIRQRLNETAIEELRIRLSREDPEVAARTDMANPVRVRRALERLVTNRLQPVTLPPFRKLKLALNPDAELLGDRIAQRVAEMMHNGWIQEVELLRQKGFRKEDPAFRAIGYRAIWDHIDRKIRLDDAIATTIAESRRYAKRQRTWLRTEPDLIELPATTGMDAVRTAMERIETVLE